MDGNKHLFKILIFLLSLGSTISQTIHGNTTKLQSCIISEPPCVQKNFTTQNSCLGQTTKASMEIQLTSDILRGMAAPNVIIRQLRNVIINGSQFVYGMDKEKWRVVISFEGKIMTLQVTNYNLTETDESLVHLEMDIGGTSYKTDRFRWFGIQGGDLCDTPTASPPPDSNAECQELPRLNATEHSCENCIHQHDELLENLQKSVEEALRNVSYGTNPAQECLQVICDYVDKHKEETKELLQREVNCSLPVWQMVLVIMVISLLLLLQCLILLKCCRQLTRSSQKSKPRSQSLTSDPLTTTFINQTPGNERATLAAV